MGSVSFLKTIHDLGTIKAGSTNHQVRYPFEGDPSQIEDIRPLCGCTANVLVQGNEIFANYTNYDKPEAITDQGVDINRRIMIFFTDGKPLKKLNAKGVLDYNTEKSHVFLEIKAHVIK